MSSQLKTYLTPAEYLAIERQAETKSEYFDGEMFAMVGASRKHNVIGTNVTGGLQPQLRGRACEIYANDMRVLIPATGLYTYPDVVVVCGEPKFEDAEVDTLINPTLIVEVLSKSTASYDRGDKFMHYRSIESLAEYLLIAQAECHIEHYRKESERRWVLTETKSFQERIKLESIECVLAVEEIYDKVIVK